jgi:hypothetical protein
LLPHQQCFGVTRTASSKVEQFQFASTSGRGLSTGRVPLGIVPTLRHLIARLSSGYLKYFILRRYRRPDRSRQLRIKISGALLCAKINSLKPRPEDKEKSLRTEGDGDDLMCRNWRTPATCQSWIEPADVEVENPFDDADTRFSSPYLVDVDLVEVVQASSVRGRNSMAHSSRSLHSSFTGCIAHGSRSS